jgi:flagellar motor switch protein FliN/FliY
MSDDENTENDDMSLAMNESAPDEGAAPEAAAEDAAAAAPEKSAAQFNEMEDAGQQEDDAVHFEYGEAMVNDVTAIYDIPVQISAVLGRSSMQVSQLLKLGRGAVVELDRKVGEAIDIYVNNRLVARGEVVVVDDKLGITMTEIVKSDKA